MVDHNQALDAAFSALAAAPRRALLRELAAGPRTVSELAAGRPMTLQAISKHLKVLERAGIIDKQRRGKQIQCRLRPGAFDTAVDWIGFHRRLWNDRLDRLEALLEDLEGDPE